MEWRPLELIYGTTLVEYANQVWHPRRLQDMDKLERVQKKATKIIIRGKKLTYENRLRKLKLPTLTYRQVRGDMIDVYKFLSGKYDKNFNYILVEGHYLVLKPEVIHIS